MSFTKISKEEWLKLSQEEKMKITNHSQQKTFKTSENDRQGDTQSLVSRDEEVGQLSNQFLRDNADFKITYLYTKKCQKCHKRYGTDFKTSKFCYKCSERPDKVWK